MKNPQPERHEMHLTCEYIILILTYSCNKMQIATYNYEI